MDKQKGEPRTKIRFIRGKNKIMENKKIKKEEFFDDCPVCRAMKAAQEQGRELTLEELKEVFKKAKEKGAIVGGEWFQEDKK